MTHHHMTSHFQKVARDLKHSKEPCLDLCRQILDNKDFHDLARQSPDSAGYILRNGFNALRTPKEHGDALLAFIQTQGALNMAEGIRPEYLLDVLTEAQKKLTPDDKELFHMLLWQTTAGKTLVKNYPAARIKMIM